jgi:pyruvate dehydrogenase E2 component (dihydrolipoamide acetyltransferase)
MAEVFNMPTLGQSMEEGTVVQWLKQEGDTVKKGDEIVEIMTDKANMPVESPSDGVLRKILVAADQTVPVSTPIAILGTADEPIDHLLGGAPAVSDDNSSSVAAAPAPVAEPVAAGMTAAPPAPSGKVFISPRARRLADDMGVPISALSGFGSGPEGRVLEKDVRAYMDRQSKPLPPMPGTRQRVSPLAAKIAGDLGVDVGDLAMGLPGSRITADHVRAHVETAKPVAPQPGGSPTVAQAIPFRGMRKIVADNVTKSRQTAPHVTLNTEADVTEMTAAFGALRAEVEKAYGTKLTYTDLLIKVTARALEDHPLCNAALIGDEIRVYADKNVGVAVATENGLIVPVVKQADSKSLGEVSVELKGLVERCRTGKQSPDDLAGGTFTITNLGAYGVDTFDPIIVPPQSCILGVGRMVQKPAVHNGQIAVRTMMSLSLSFDHRVLDGAPAALFLKRVRELLESPVLIFAHV